MVVETYGVYVQADDAGRITAINSDAFLPGLDGWTKIDQGAGDKYHHAQGNYLDKPIMDERCVYRYKLTGGAVVERTAAEMDADYTPAPAGLTSRVAELEAQLAAYEAAYQEGVAEA